MDRKKILIIDDEKAFSEMVKLNLETTGKYDVVIENDASNAIYTALQCQPDLILLDVIMASKDGPEVAIEMKGDPRLKDMPIVFLTATVTQREVDEEDGTIGGRAFIAKPSSLESLIESIERNMIPA